MRIWGSNVKPLLYREFLQLGVKIFDRVMITCLLNEKGKQGVRVIGATGFNTRNCEFHIFNSKATVLCMAGVSREWIFSTELRGTTPSGEGTAVAWKAGVECMGMEHIVKISGAFGYLQHGAGNCTDAWYACSIVDANGREIPWVNADGNVITFISDRYRPINGRKLLLRGGGVVSPGKTISTPAGGTSKIRREYQGPWLIPDLAERIKKGEFVPPLYADLPGMPEHERKAIFGLMVAQEARFLIPIYRNYTQAGFDPNKDLLQVYKNGWSGVGPPQWLIRESKGVIIVDWDLKTMVRRLLPMPDLRMN